MFIIGLLQTSSDEGRKVRHFCLKQLFKLRLMCTDKTC